MPHVVPHSLFFHHIHSFSTKPLGHTTIHATCGTALTIFPPYPFFFHQTPRPHHHPCHMWYRTHYFSTISILFPPNPSATPPSMPHVVPHSLFFHHIHSFSTKPLGHTHSTSQYTPSYLSIKSFLCCSRTGSRRC